MATDAYSLAVWKDCEECRGTASDGFDPDMNARPCPACNGHGKTPTFIPLSEIETHHDASQPEIKSITLTITALQEWLERQEN